jgi:hypothetical protein
MGLGLMERKHLVSFVTSTVTPDGSAPLVGCVEERPALTDTLTISITEAINRAIMIPEVIFVLFLVKICKYLFLLLVFFP